LREFLTRNGHPHTYIDLDSDTTAQELLDRFNLKIDEIPVVICSGKTVLRNPTTQRLAECLGFAGTVDESRIRDVAIVGAGPAGLAAAVYAASEGLDAVVIEAESRWTGGRELEDRELPWFPYWHLRPGAHGPRRCPGRKIRRSDVGGATSGPDQLRSEAVPALAGEWQHSAGSQHHHRRWSAIQ
jgi:hypothetical protein